MAVVCVASTSGSNSQSVLPITAGPLLSTVGPIVPSDTSPEETTSSRRLKISSIPKYQENIQLKKITTPFFINEESDNIEEKRKMQRTEKSKVSTAQILEV